MQIEGVGALSSRAAATLSEPQPKRHHESPIIFLLSDSRASLGYQQESFPSRYDFYQITYLSVCATSQHLYCRLESIRFSCTKPGWAATQGSPPRASKQKNHAGSMISVKHEALHAYSFQEAAVTVY